MFESVVSYFSADPLKLLYLVGGSGGIWYWVNLYRARRRVSVRYLAEYYDVIGEPNVLVSLDVEVTNVGESPTALTPYVEVVGLTPEHRKRVFRLEANESSRALRPHDPKAFRFEGECDAIFPFLWYKTYVFSLTRGSKTKMRIRSANGERLSLLQHLIGNALFVVGVRRGTKA